MQVAAKKSLVGDARLGAPLTSHFAALFGLDHLMQTVFPAAVRHDAAGIFVNDLHLAVAHDIVLVAAIEMLRRKRLHDEFLARSRHAPNPVVGYKVTDYFQSGLFILFPRFSPRTNAMVRIHVSKITNC